MPQPALPEYLDDDRLKTLFEEAKYEDLGVLPEHPHGLDLTSKSLIPETLIATARFRSRQAGVLAGLQTLPTLLSVYDPEKSVNLESIAQDGEVIAPGQVIATLCGPMRLVLAIERVALNTLSHLSGIATLTAAFAARCENTRASVYDTRKTLPGLRGLQKYAVACGGGKTHRMGLYDAVLIKDNHLAHLKVSDYAVALNLALERAKALNPAMAFAMVEVDSLNQLRATLPVPGVDLVLLDNMAPDTLRQAVALRDELAPRVELEASGGVSLDTISEIAQTGVDRVSVGALTHSAPSLDLGLDIVES